tara:strand:- start:3937 stop:4527 length:591 start_codon:yes stop_codon:yes gene_type:complete
MFNGIIKKIGKINRISKKKDGCILEVSTSMKFYDNEIGSSVSCSGACLTLDKIYKKKLLFYLSKETLKKTVFKYTKRGDIINLEKSLKYGERISGHFVQGHVDTTSIIEKIEKTGKFWLINFKIDKKYRIYLISKGSITVNGISLTIAKLLKNGFQISVIPKTLKLTNLIYSKEKDYVNIELDVLGKYIKKFISKK